MKKPILIIFLAIICLSVKAQKPEVDSIKKYLVINKDKTAADETLSPLEVITGKTEDGYTYSVYPSYNITSRYIAISYNCPGIGCVNQNNKIEYFFADKSTYTDVHSIIWNCKGVFLSLYSHWPDTNITELASFNHSIITSVKLNGDTKATNIKLPGESALLLKNQIKWIKYYFDNRKKIGEINFN